MEYMKGMCAFQVSQAVHLRCGGVLFLSTDMAVDFLQNCGSIKLCPRFLYITVIGFSFSQMREILWMVRVCLLSSQSEF